jgi:GNAT superfamily N-acetyltransferase
MDRPVTGYAFVTIKDQPGLVSQIQEVEKRSWPEFIAHDAVGNQYWSRLYEVFPEYQFALVEETTGRVVAVGNSLPLVWNDALTNLPDEGWDWALAKGFEDWQAGKTPTIQCALSIPILPEYRGQGLSKYVVQAMKAIGQAHSLKTLIAPVRPNLKSRYPLTPIEKYIQWVNDPGVPFDAWIRVHTRLGASIIKVCHQSMRILGAIADWEKWTTMRFPESGTYIVPEALVPIVIDYEANLGTYIEPNVWMAHLLEAR